MSHRDRHVLVGDKVHAIKDAALFPSTHEGPDCPLCLRLSAAGQITGPVLWCHPDSIRNPLSLEDGVGVICRICSKAEKSAARSDESIPFQVARATIWRAVSTKPSRFTKESLQARLRLKRALARSRTARMQSSTAAPSAQSQPET